MILIAFPAYNEERYIGTLVLKAKKYYSCDVLVLDDGSTDNTREIAILAGAKVVTYKTNKGKGKAIQNIFRIAKYFKYDTLVLLDADGQHNPDEIPLLVAPIQNGFDISVGVRHKNDIPAYRRIGQDILNKMTRLAGGRGGDSQSGFRAFSREAIERLVLHEDGFAIESEMMIKANELKLKVKEVPISVIYHNDGSTMNPISHGTGVVERIIEIIAERRPLSFFGFIGLVLYIIGATFGFRALDIFYATGKWALGSLMLAGLLIIIATVSLFSGIMLFAISRWKNRR